MRVSNPYANLEALLDTTRQLDPEEMAELHLEQGFVDRALAIYDELTAKEPHNASYRTRREWLARMLEAQRPREKRRRELAPVRRAREAAPITADTTLIGAPPPKLARAAIAEVVVQSRIVRVR